METKGNAQRQNASLIVYAYMYPKFDSSLHHNIDRDLSTNSLSQAK